MAPISIVWSTHCQNMVNSRFYSKNRCHGPNLFREMGTAPISGEHPMSVGISIYIHIYIYIGSYRLLTHRCGTHRQLFDDPYLFKSKILVKRKVEYYLRCDQKGYCTIGNVYSFSFSMVHILKAES